MIVLCPKCKTKLKVAEEKISDAGSRFKCPKCSTVLLIKKPKRPAVEAKPIDTNTVLVAHGNREMLIKIENVVKRAGYAVERSMDGIDAMVKIDRIKPFLTIIDVALPKIYGFEICKRIKSRHETKGIKVILVASIYDKERYKREPQSLYDADDYIEGHQIEKLLIDKIGRLSGKVQAGELPKEQPMPPQPPAEEKPYLQKAEVSAPPEIGIEKIEKAKRLARTIVSDITLYNPKKVEEAIRRGVFFSDFSDEIKEGQKLYDSRIPEDVRAVGDFYKEAIGNFIIKKKKAMGLA